MWRSRTRSFGFKLGLCFTNDLVAKVATEVSRCPHIHPPSAEKRREVELDGRDVEETRPQSALSCRSSYRLRTSSSIITGTWSDGLFQLRVRLSICAPRNRSAASGDRSWWSILMPLFRCHAPAW